MTYSLLQSILPAVTDSLIAAAIDSSRVAIVEKITTSTPSELMSDMADWALRFGVKLLAALTIFVIGSLLLRWIKRLLSKMFTRRNAERAVVTFTMSLVSTVMWAIIILSAIGALGVQTTSIAALLAAGGMAIGMAVSGTVQNFTGGIMLLVFKPFKAGDYIEAQGYAGTVTELNITNTKILTPDNKVIILPNGALSNGVINNYTGNRWRRVDFTVSVEYGSDADKVREVLLGIASSDKRVKTTDGGAPGDPFVGISALTSSSVDFSFKVWVESPDYWGVYYAFNEEIYKQLPGHGIDFPFAQVTVHMPDKD